MRDKGYALIKCRFARQSYAFWHRRLITKTSSGASFAYLCADMLAELEAVFRLSSIIRHSGGMITFIQKMASCPRNLASRAWFASGERWRGKCFGHRPVSSRATASFSRRKYGELNRPAVTRQLSR